MYFNFFHKNENLRELFLAWVFTVLYVGSCLIILSSIRSCFIPSGRDRKQNKASSKERKAPFLSTSPSSSFSLGFNNNNKGRKFYAQNWRLLSFCVGVGWDDGPKSHKTQITKKLENIDKLFFIILVTFAVISILKAKY